MEELILHNSGTVHDVIFDMECLENHELTLTKVKEANVPTANNILAFKALEQALKLVASFPEVPRTFDKEEEYMFVDLRTYPYEPMGSYEIATVEKD